MKPTAKPQSKIPTTGKNTNQKKKPSPSESMDMDTSLLKKNEFTLIIAGALVATVLVFFLFFRDSGNSSGNGIPASQGTGAAGTEVDKAMEKRVAELEVAMTRLASSPSIEGAATGSTSAKGLGELEQRIERLETALTLKMDSLISRVTKAERSLAALKKAGAAKPAPVVKVSKTESAPAQKAPVTKKPVQQSQKASMFHTVQKGETLWSISQKYKTSVAAIRKLNNLTPEDKIYPGSNILVR